MKKLFILFLLFSLLKSAHAQSVEFPDTGVIWRVGYSNGDGTGTKYDLYADSFVNLNGKTYILVNEYADFTDPQTYQSRLIYRKEGKKVFMKQLNYYSCMPYDTSEFLLYDFNLGINDSISYRLYNQDSGTHKVVFIIDTITIIPGSNPPRRKFELRNAPSSDYDAFYFGRMWWIEGVGSSWGAFVPYGQNYFGVGCYLGCQRKRDGTILYSPGESPNITEWCTRRLYGVGVHENPENLKVEVYPNPASDELKIEAERDLTSIKIYNTVGVEMPLEITHLGKLIRINISNFVPGLYILRLQSSNAHISRLVSITH